MPNTLRYYLFFLSLVFCHCLYGSGWVESREDKTIIHITLGRLPDPNDVRMINRAELAIINNFKNQFATIFKQRYAEKYRNNPEKYGEFNWDNIEVDLRPAGGIQIPGMETDLMAIAGETAPDVIYSNFRRSSNFIDNGFLYPLDLPEDGYYTDLSQDEIDFMIHPKIRPVVDRMGPNREKHVWAMPIGGILIRVMLYNKVLFDKQGLEYPNNNWTWDDLHHACRELTQPEKNIYGTTFIPGKPQSWEWLSFLWSAGGEVMTHDESTNAWSLQFGSPAGAQALDFYVKLTTEKWLDSRGNLQRGYVLRSPDGYGSQWRTDRVGILFDYLDEKMLSAINPEKYGMAPIPFAPNGKRHSEINSRMLGLFSKIKHPAVRDAAWEYIKFITSKSAMAVRTQYMVEAGYGQFINPRYLEMFGYPEIIRQSPPGWKETFEIAIDAGKPEPFGKNSNFAYEMMSAPLEEAIQLSLRDQLPVDETERLKLFENLLNKAEIRANEVMIGTISQNKRLLRNGVAGAVLIVLLLCSVYIFKSISKDFSPQTEQANEAKDKPNFIAKFKTIHFKRSIRAYLILLPALITLFLWQYVPLARGLVMAFQDYSLLGKSTWVGLNNFGDILFDNLWWVSIWNSVRFSFLAVALSFAPPIALAILLQEVPRGKVFFRVLFYLPAVLTGLITILMWRQFYDPSEHGGLNSLIGSIPAFVFILIAMGLMLCAWKLASRLQFHHLNLASFVVLGMGAFLFYSAASFAWPILFPAYETLHESLSKAHFRLLETQPEPIRWLTNPNRAMLSIILPLVWAQMGPGCLIYLAALKTVPEDLYDAAEIDGANFVDKILFIVFPNLKIIIIINFTGALISSIYGAADYVMAMTGGGANTEVSDLHIFFKAFVFLDFGQATAMAWIIGFILVGFTVYQLRVLSKSEFKTTSNPTH